MANLSVDQVKMISSLPPGVIAEDALCSTLNLPSCDRAKDIQYSLYLEIVYNHLRFAVDKGFSWPQVCQIPYIAGSLLQRVKVQKLPTFLKYLFTQSSNWSQILGPRNYKLYMEFLCQSIVQHFLLYKYVFSFVPRKVPQLNLTVYTPVEPYSLSEGKPIEIWNYEQQFAELVNEEQELLKKYESMEAKCTQEMFDEVLDQTEGDFEKEDVETLVKNVASVFCDKIQDTLMASVEQKHEEMLINIKKVLLPRPPALGPYTKLKARATAHLTKKPSQISNNEI
ncbi:uncharacterized protein C8orf74 homolog isoform X2 [Octopus sinensis]|uniref:Uncharacterized protein C8orf74 homolog isoform X2 n=1 Tax=Octopus sinensis TaxID=2607531 RepID=A0A7E6FKZ7_9MOLL|nr:uncharacterized protein C8orf74 homolog isoform X2 [Octopus sinensis]